MLASCPASILNHFSTLLGIPFRFGINSSRSRLGLAHDLGARTSRSAHDHEADLEVRAPHKAGGTPAVRI